MTRSLREDALSIWRAAVAAVDSETLVRQAVQRRGDRLVICGDEVDVAQVGRIAVVGGGKAAAGMAAGFEAAVGDDLLSRVTGWVNVPEGSERVLRRVHVHPARPAGRNEPTEAGIEGTRRILEIVEGLDAGDLCIVLLSGGGSALLPAPVDGVSLADLQAVTSLLMRAGAPIEHLNCVRKQLSRVQGGRLAHAIRAGRTFVLIISDVVGDPLDVIASGPTVPDRSPPGEALRLLEHYAVTREAIPESVWSALSSAQREPPTLNERVSNHVIGSNTLALEAAARRASEIGYVVHSLGPANEGNAQDVGRELARLCRQIRECHGEVLPPACVLSGGEPTVKLAMTDQPQKGGRNQEVALAALDELWGDGLDRIAILSGGTDGEDGPTDAAGAVIDSELLDSARRRGLTPAPFLAINNSYPFFEQTGGLIKTGPTHTNVMDVRVALIL